MGVNQLKIVRLTYAEKEHYGLLIGNKTVLSLSTFSSSDESLIPRSLEELISRDSTVLREVERKSSEMCRKYDENAIFNSSEVTFLAPIACPRKIICLGLNYHDHAAEAGNEIPSELIIFMKPSTAVLGPDLPIIKPSFVRQLDYEAELAVVIGKKGKKVPIDEAEHYIFGYTIMNDVSARDIQFKDKQWTRGKSFDTFAPMGPCITTANQIENPQNLQVRTWVNDEIRQDSSTKNMVFNIYQIIHQLSRVMTLEPCDIIATGTPAGVGVFMKPPKFLQPGDNVRIEIEGIGRLQNEVIEE